MGLKTACRALVWLGSCKGTQAQSQHDASCCIRSEVQLLGGCRVVVRRSWILRSQLWQICRQMIMQE